VIDELDIWLAMVACLIGLSVVFTTRGHDDDWV